MASINLFEKKSTYIKRFFFTDYTAMALIIFLVLSLLLQGAFGEIICEDLPVEMCSFSIATSGKRCLLENYEVAEGRTGFQCKTSEVVVKNMAEWIESDECTNACGVDRKSVGISSDSLLHEPHFTAKLCSAACHQNCPNIIDLYSNLAIGEGVFLPHLCHTQRNMPRRAMIMSTQLLSSGAASGPISAPAAAAGPMSDADAPASSDSSESVGFGPAPM